MSRSHYSAGVRVLSMNMGLSARESCRGSWSHPASHGWVEGGHGLVVLFTEFSAQVDVEVYLCYCTGDECNKEDITAGVCAVGSAVVILLSMIMLLCGVAL